MFMYLKYVKLPISRPKNGRREALFEQAVMQRHSIEEN